MARDIKDVVATAMTDCDSTPPTRVKLHRNPQVAVDLEALSDEAKSQSGMFLGHGIYGR